MEDVLDVTLYHDDFLTRTLTTSTLYDKSNLDLTFVDNNNLPDDEKHDQGDTNSPNLDFLKLGSPDLEQMFLNIHESGDVLSNDDENSSAPTAAFNIHDDLVATENCFTEALQQLHDKDDMAALELLDRKIKVEKQDTVRPKSNYKKSKESDAQTPSHHSSKPRSRAQHLRRQLAPPKRTYNNNISNNNAHIQGKGQHREPIPVHPLQQQVMPHVSLPEQIAMNNQMAMLNSMNVQQGLNIHHLQQQQQQQQEIAFLTHAMSFQADRENIQAHMINNAYPGHNNQVLPHIQQKILEQQIFHQQLSNGYHANDQNQMPSMTQIDSLATMGMDEQTIKMFVDNPHLAPINLEIQELIKRERKKLRNRIASSKCRKRKLEREGRLEDKVRNLKEKNIELNAVANALKQQICDLKQRVMDHVSEGCQIVLPS